MNSNTSRWKSRALIIVVVVGAIAAGIWYWKRPKSEAVEYQTATLTRGEVVQVITATGQLNPVKNVTVGSQISGIIQNLFVDFNSQVTQGQVIAQLDPATYKANVASAQGDVENAKANLELARVDFRRAEALNKAQLIATSDYDKAVATLHQAEAQVTMKEATLQRAQVDLSRCTIYAPVDGIVISRAVDVGQTVAASLSAPELFVIANDLTKMQIDANVAESDVGGVDVGQDVEFKVDAFPYRTFHGKVKQVRNAPITVQNVVTYDTVVEVNNDDLKLKPGMTATVSIIVARRSDVVRIPNAALRFRVPEVAASSPPTNGMVQPASEARGNGRRGGGERGDNARGERQVVRTIYVVSGGTNAIANGSKIAMEPVEVKLGISDGFFTEAISGVEEGDTVITGSISLSASQAGGNPFGSGGMPRMRRL
jgi:HlyD family secretion protein